MLAEVDGIPQVIVLSRTSLNGVDVRDGAELWSPSLTSNAQIVTPIVTGNLVIFSAYRSPTTALRLLHQGSDWRVEPAWQNDEVTLYTSTPVLEAGILYGLSYSGRGRFFALDMATGELKWATQGREGQSASIQSTGQHLLVLLDSGELRVLGIDPSQYRLEASYTVSESPTWTHPVFYRKPGAGQEREPADSLPVVFRMRSTGNASAAAPRRRGGRRGFLLGIRKPVLIDRRSFGPSDE